MHTFSVEQVCAADFSTPVPRLRACNPTVSKANKCTKAGKACVGHIPEGNSKEKERQALCKWSPSFYTLSSIHYMIEIFS